jgi:predicted dehydrogenase
VKGENMPEQISVAVIGAGMAGRSHAAAYRMANSVSGPGLPPIRLAAIADANTALAEDGARRYGYEKAVSSWEAVAEDPDIDAVSIVVGNALHRPIAEALVKAGKHVLCEKPLAGDGGAGEIRPGGHRGGLHLPALAGDRRDPRPHPQW